MLLKKIRRDFLWPGLVENSKDFLILQWCSILDMNLNLHFSRLHDRNTFEPKSCLAFLDLAVLSSKPDRIF